MMATEERYNTFEDRPKPSKDDFSKYLKRVGRGLNCRLDVPILSLEDLKWAATVFSDLAAQLRELAYNDTREDVIRVLAGRYAMEDAKRELFRRNERKEVAKRIVHFRVNEYDPKLYKMSPIKKR